MTKGQLKLKWLALLDFKMTCLSTPQPCSAQHQRWRHQLSHLTCNIPSYITNNPTRSNKIQRDPGETRVTGSRPMPGLILRNARVNLASPRCSGSESFCGLLAPITVASIRPAVPRGYSSDAACCC